MISFYEGKLKAEGFETQRASMNFNGSPSATLAATSGGRTLSITAAAQDGATQALVTYSEKP